MINTEVTKNKVFSCVKFGINGFYFYILVGRGAGWGKAELLKGRSWFLVFSASGGKLPLINTSPGGTVEAVPFFMSCDSIYLRLK